ANAGDTANATRGSMACPNTVTNNTIAVVCVKYKLKEILPKNNRNGDLKIRVQNGDSIIPTRTNTKPAQVNSRAIRLSKAGPTIHWNGTRINALATNHFRFR